MYAEFKAALIADAALVIDNTLPDLENTFAPVPPKSDDSWLNTLLGLVALGVPVVGGKFFDSGTSLVSPIFFSSEVSDFADSTLVLSKIPAMSAKSDVSQDHYKSVMNAMLTSPVTIATNMKSSNDP